MGTTDGIAASALSGLARGIREYSLYQAVMTVIDRLRDAHPQRSWDQLYEAIEFGANPSLGFPGADVEQVQFFEENGVTRARLRLNLMSLSGAASPLPAYYAEQVLDDHDSARLTGQFLDLFHHRLQRLMLPIWRKYRYRTRFERGASDSFSAQMFALIGLRNGGIRASGALDWKRLLPYLGLLSLRAHSAALIESVLRFYFKHEPLTLEQCVERRVVILHEQLSRLGSANSLLGGNAVVGEQVRDCAGKFRIHVRELTWARLHDFLPVGSDHGPLCALVRFILRDPLEYDLCLALKVDELRELRIGEHNTCRLGWTSWLGHTGAAGVVTLYSRTHQG